MIKDIVVDQENTGDIGLDGEPLPFVLQDGEKIVKELKPQMIGFLVIRNFGPYVMLTLIFVLALALMPILGQPVLGLVVAFLIVPAVALIVTIKPYVTYLQFKYWVTNHRVIGRRGVIGYSIDSIPLENVTDVVITRSVLDRLLGIASLIVVPMAGSAKIQGGAPDERTESPNFFPAIKHQSAIDLQKFLFSMRDQRKGMEPAKEETQEEDDRTK